MYKLTISTPLADEKIKLQFETKYFVNQDKKIVVAKLEQVYPPTYYVFPQTPNERTINEILSKIKPIKCAGIARCSEEDAFNVETGKKLALSRAVQKALRVLSKAANSYEDQMYSGFLFAVSITNAIAERCSDENKKEENILSYIYGLEESE